MRDFLPHFNGVDFVNTPLIHSQELVVDACLTGVDATLGNKWYEAEIPQDIRNKQYTIAELEM